MLFRSNAKRTRVVAKKRNVYLCKCGCGKRFVSSIPNAEYINKAHRLRHKKAKEQATQKQAAEQALIKKKSPFDIS